VKTAKLKSCAGKGHKKRRQLKAACVLFHGIITQNMLRCGNLSYGYTFKGRSLSLPGEAIAAVNRTVFSGLEGNLRLAAATGADGREHFSLVCAAIFSGLTAGLASLGLIRKALFRVEFLFAGGEDKLAAALFACQCLVLGHGIEYLLIKN
jgi:hypothetical protein